MHVTETSTIPHRTLAVLFIFAISLRLIYVLAIHPDALIWADEIRFDTIAWELAETGRFVSTPYDAPPGMPAFLAAIYAIFGHELVAVRVVQALLGGVLAVLVAMTAATLFGRRTGMIAGAITAAYPPLVYMAGVLYAEHLAAVLLAGTVMACVWGQQRNRGAAFALAGVLVGALALTRPTYLVLIPVVAMYAGVAVPMHRGRNALIVILTAGAMVLPWTVRNAIVFEHFMPVSTGVGLHLWRGNNDAARGDADDRHIMPRNEFWERGVATLPPDRRASADTRTDRLIADLAALDPAAQDGRYRQEGARWIRGNPARFMGLAGRRLLTLHSPFTRTHSDNDAGSRRNVLIATLSILPVLALGLVGAFLALRRRRSSWILHAAILVPTLLYAALTASTRFRLPLDPLWIILASVTLARLTGSRHRDA